MHDLDSPSPWIVQHGLTLPPRQRVLDVACGAGRHAKWFSAQGHLATAVDRDRETLKSLGKHEEIDVLAIDLEIDVPQSRWPFRPDSFDVVVVCNYLWRPTFAGLLATVKPGGFLIYETFMQGHERFGKPSRPDFLLRRGELTERLGHDFRLIAAYEGELYDEGCRAYAAKSMAFAQKNNA